MSVVSHSRDVSQPGRYGLIATYRVLPAISGRSFLPISFLGRLPLTMAPVSILTYVAAATGSFAAAGLAATATAVGTALGAPLMGALADRHGQRPVLSVAVPVNTVALLVLALFALPQTLLLVVCAAVGFSMPQVGGMARARWLALTRPHAGTAMAFEGTADELAFVLGPALAGLLAATWGTSSALFAAAGAALLAAGAFATHPTHRATPGTNRTPASSASVIMQSRTPLLRLLTVPVLAMVLMGAFFSATQSGVTAYAAGIGKPTAGGLIYALMAVGSAVTALGTALLPAGITARARCTVAAAGLLIGGLAMILAPTTALLCAAVLLTGLSVGPMLVTLNQVVGERAPRQSSASAMAYLSAGTVVGIAVGATSAGTLADIYGSTGALTLAAAAAALLLTVSAIGLRERA